MNWLPIREAKQDGTAYLLWYPASALPENIASHCDAGLAVDGWYFSSPKQIDDGWETAFGSIGEPTHFATISTP